MAFDIREFSARLGQGGILPKNKYDVQIFFPLGSPMGGSFLNLLTGQASVGVLADGELTSQTNVAQDLSYRCISTTLPNMSITTNSTNRFGVGLMEKMPYSASNQDVDMTFMCDRYGDAYKFWYAWMNYIFAANGEETNNIVSQIFGGRQFYTAEYKDNYAATVVITVYDNAGGVAIQYFLYKAYPISLGTSTLSAGPGQGFVNLDVSLNFREFAVNDGTMQINGILNLVGATLNGIGGLINTITNTFSSG